MQNIKVHIAYPPYMAFMSITFLILDQSIPIPLKYDLLKMAFQCWSSACNLSCESPSHSGKDSSLVGHSSGQSVPRCSMAAGTLCRHGLIKVYLKNKQKLQRGHSRKLELINNIHEQKKKKNPLPN